jgi:hypothetical protein
MQADMLELPFDDECFDLVIEKGTMVNYIVFLRLTYSGILAWHSKLTIIIPTLFKHVIVKLNLNMLTLVLKDVLFVDSGDPWNPKPETMAKVMSTLKGVHRVLKAGGTFISITFGQV